jgi:hypothetical protein
MDFLGGEDGLLERLFGEAFGESDLADDEALRKAYARGFDTLLGQRVQGLTLAAAHDAFVRNRFFEHDAPSQLRAGDTHAPRVAVPERFASPRRVMVSADGVQMAEVGPLRPMSAALVIVEAGAGYAKPLQIDLTLLAGRLADDGVRVHAFRDGQAGERWTALAQTDAGFGTAHQKLYLVVVNGSLGDDAGVRVRVTAPGAVVAPVKASFGFYRFQQARRGAQVLEVHDMPFDPDECMLAVGQSCTRMRRSALTYSTVEGSITVTRVAQREWLIAATSTATATAPSAGAGEGSTTEAYISPSLAVTTDDYANLALTVECVAQGEVKTGGSTTFATEFSALLPGPVAIAECQRRLPGLSPPGWTLDGSATRAAAMRFPDLNYFLTARAGAAAGTLGSYAVSTQATVTRLRYRYAPP